MVNMPPAATSACIRPKRSAIHPSIHPSKELPQHAKEYANYEVAHREYGGARLRWRYFGADVFDPTLWAQLEYESKENYFKVAGCCIPVKVFLQRGSAGAKCW